MDNFARLILKVSQKISEIKDLVDEADCGDVFTYVFCFSLDVPGLFGEGHQTAGYSWHINERTDFEELLLILEEAYKLHGDDLTDLEWFRKN